MFGWKHLNTNNWYLDASNQTSGTIATLTVSSGRLVFTHSNTNSYWDGFGASFTCTVGEVYVVSFNIHSVTSMNLLRISNTASQHDDDIQVAGSNVAGLHAHTFTATATTMYLHWNAYTTAGTMQLNSVSVRIAEEDRSVNNKGLQVFGTITKTPVATGAELVAYSGFDTSNYLFQPHNTDLQVGTGDYSVMLWYKPGNGSIDSREIFANLRGSTNHWVLSKEYTNKFVFDTVTDPNNRTLSVWNHVCGVRESGIAKLYVNGELVGSASANDNINDTSDGLIVGQNPDNNDWRTRGSLALLRLSASALSAEQVKNIFDDEKCLYHENAKCTLHGTSDAVTALAYDDKTDVLHVGTSGGRSDFRGLNRINNTTTAVTTAISASNGLVAEQ